jgi:hypothetical protein
VKEEAKGQKRVRQDGNGIGTEAGRAVMTRAAKMKQAQSEANLKKVDFKEDPASKRAKSAPKSSKPADKP